MWDWTTNGETPMCSVVLDDNFGKQVRGERLKKLKLKRELQILTSTARRTLNAVFLIKGLWYITNVDID